MLTIEPTTPGRWTIRDTTLATPLLVDADTETTKQFIGDVLFVRECDARQDTSMAEIDALAADYDNRVSVMGNPVARRQRKRRVVPPTETNDERPTTNAAIHL